VKQMSDVKHITGIQTRKGLTFGKIFH